MNSLSSLSSRLVALFVFYLSGFFGISLSFESSR